MVTLSSRHGIWVKFHQIHPALNLSIDNYNVLYCITAELLLGKKCTSCDWYELKKRVSTVLQNWNKLYVCRHRTELHFLSSLATDASACANLSEDAMRKCKDRLCELQEEDIKLKRIIHVRNLRVSSQEVNVLLKTSIFQYLKPFNLIVVMKIDGVVYTGMDLARQLELLLIRNFGSSTHAGIGFGVGAEVERECYRKEVDDFAAKYFSSKGILEVISTLNRFAPAGPDMLPFLVYKWFSYLLVPILQLVFREWLVPGAENSMRTGTYFVAFNKKKVVLRSGESMDLNDVPSSADLRPISIQDTDSKIFAKILNRAAVLELDGKLHHNQFCVRGRTINMAINLLKEAHIEAKRGRKHGYLLVLLDMKSAYDKVDLGFLLSQIKALIPNAALCAGLQNYLCNKFGAVKLDGRISEKFKIKVGIGQGSPLSSTCYAIYVNKLLMELEGKLHGIFVPVFNGYVKLISYADDLALIVNGEDELNLALSIIEAYQVDSGLELNKAKSAVYHLDNFHVSESFPLAAKQRFLGLPFPFFDFSAKSKVQSKLLEDIKTLLGKLKFASLSLLTRIEIINKLCIPKLSYVGRFYRFTKKFFALLDTILSKFIWNGGLALVSRRILYASRSAGGLNMIKPSLFLHMLRANLYNGWINYLIHSNFLLSFDPQDTPPPVAVQGTDFLVIYKLRLDLLDDLPIGSGAGKLSCALLRTGILDPAIFLVWPSCPSFMKMVMRSFLPSNVLSFLYKLAHVKLPFRNLLVNKYGMNMDATCELCHRVEEDADHVFLECGSLYSLRVWLQGWLNVDILCFNKLFDLLEWCMNHKDKLRLMGIALFIIWKMRCQQIFLGIHFRPLHYMVMELKKFLTFDRAILRPDVFANYWRDSMMNI